MVGDAMTWLNRVHFGDCRESMRAMIAAGVKVNCIVTSPPYWGLRDYGHPGQLGLESTPQEYVANMVEVFWLARDLLADDGTLWLNLGDSYHNGDKGGYAKDRVTATDSMQRSNLGANFIGSPNRQPQEGLKPKDLCGIPWRVAFALQADGWYLRQDIIWHKPNPMPESVRDRCTKAHEYIFLLSKNERYYYDADAIAEPLSYSSVERLSQPNLENQEGSDRVPGKTNGNMKAVARDSWNGSTFDRGKTGEMMQTRGGLKPYEGKSTKDFASGGAQDASETKRRIVDGILAGDITTRNKRSVWTVTTKPFKGAHFATFPPDLIEPCIMAGCPVGGIVLDPFMGSGTTAQVAQALGRQWIGCELNEDYGQMQQDRTRQTGMAL